MGTVEVIKASNTLSSRRKYGDDSVLRVAAYCRVSTDTEDQINSYQSQVKHYTEFINKNELWSFAGIYADEGITGTQTTKREDFQRLINDCQEGWLDMVITKSISRFARNTLDTLQYVRMLKEKGIAIFFEEENINTMTMDGELLLTILSSVAQQEVENISANVKKGLKMMMQRGELVGFPGCLGYDYNQENKTLVVNKEEAKIVKYIFKRYVEGLGAASIGKELQAMGCKTKRGSAKWAETTIIGIIKNEKYIGDVLQGKTFTVDPISKRRLDNFGEEDQFYIRNHHEPIIDVEIFQKAQEILNKRAKPRRPEDGKRKTYTRKYAFSCMLECGYCSNNLSRRTWHSGSNYHKVIWQCVNNTKNGKQFCPHAKGLAEEIIQSAFLESYQILCSNHKDVIEEFITRTEKALSENGVQKQVTKIEKEIEALNKKSERLVEMHLENIIDKDTYQQKYEAIAGELGELRQKRNSLENASTTELTLKNRVNEFRKMLDGKQILKEFDRGVFESVIEKVIVGGYDEDGKKDPALLTFIYKSGFENNVNGKDHKPPRRNAMGRDNDNKLSSYSTDQVWDLCSFHEDNTCRVRVVVTSN